MVGLLAQCGSCGLQFQSPRGYDIGPGIAVEATGKTITCPNCGNDANVVDGMHTIGRDGSYRIDAIKGTWRAARGRSPEELQELHALLTRLAAQSAPPEVVEAAVEETAPWFVQALRTLNRAGTQNAGALGILSALLALLAILIALKGGDAAPVTNNNITNVTNNDNVTFDIDEINLADECPEAVVAEILAELKRSGWPSKNSLCYCGSRKKYKKCHGAPESQP